MGEPTYYGLSGYELLEALSQAMREGNTRKENAISAAWHWNCFCDSTDNKVPGTSEYFLWLHLLQYEFYSNEENGK